MTTNGSRITSTLALTALLVGQVLSNTAHAEIAAALAIDPLTAATASTDMMATAPAPAPAASTTTTPATANTTVTPTAPAVTPIFTAKDWRLLDLGTSCVAETVTAVDGVNHHLEVRVEKVAASPVEITIRSEVASSATIGFTATLDRAKTKVYAFAKLSGNGADETFWNIPRGSEEFVSYLKREMKVDAQAYEAAGVATKLVSFSLRGSSDTLANLGRKCAAGLTIPTTADTAFEKAFLPQSVATVDLNRINSAKADTLRALTKTAREAFLSSKVSQSEIEKLNAKYLKEIKELAGLRSNIDRLTSKEVARLEAARQTAQNAIAQSEADIQNLKPQIATTETALTQANTDYEAAYNTLKPLLPENNRLAANVRAAQGRQTDAQNRVNQADSAIARAKADLQSLQNESQRLRSEYSGAQNEAQNARDEAQRANQEARNFDYQRELRQRLQSDRRIDNLQREIQNFEQRIQAQQGAVAQAENERNRLNGELLACQQASPARDCSPERQRLTDAQRRFQDLRQGIQALEQGRDQKRHEIAQIRQEIEGEVARIQQRLDRRVADARAVLQQSEMRLRDIENRMRSVDQIEIPDRQNDIARLNNERAAATQDLANAQRSVRNAQTELANYRQSTNFDALQADVNAKLAAVNGLKTQLATIDREIKKREQTIAVNQKQLAAIAVEMDKVLAQIKAKEARSTEVQKALEPYELAKADLTAKKGASDQVFATAQNDFAANL